ncbi:hypothetical protein ACIQPQ_13745 [Streptomyces sp. NPDC091281]|uniref:hypothetical protein n=1 Tax=Streptomyces sp. NPDC091281 TaxID=3365985 RepID=UPI0038308480
MGIESDQVVYEYLSRVGDVAHQQQLSSATRMRLVSELRNEIDRRRARTPVDSPAAVRRILDRLGSPDDVVAAADGTRAPVPEAPTAAVPTQRAQGDRRDEREAEKTDPPRKGLRRVVPLPRPRSDPPQDAPAPSVPADSVPAGPRPGGPDWWRKDDGPGSGDDSGVLDLGDGITGFVGGIEIADMLKSPATLRREEEEARELATLRQREKERAEAEKAAEGAAVVEQKKAAGSGLRRLLRPSSPRPAAAAAATGPRWTNPLLLLAALCLVAGAVLGNWLALAVGWLIAWASRRLTDTETKLALFGLPGLSVAAGLLWLWGRTEGRWGDPIADGRMNDAVAETWPWVLRGAAITTALFLVWRSQRGGKA